MPFKFGKDTQILKGVTKNQNQTQPTDQNKPRNIFKAQGKKDLPQKQSIKTIAPIITVQQQPWTSFRSNSIQEDIDKRKWECVTKVHQLTSKAGYIHSLKNLTVFLAYSLAEKTVQLVLEGKLKFDYWATCCMFMSMKYEEIYPPRLRDLQGIIKAPIDIQIYRDSELIMWDFIGMDMNFVSLNTRLSEFLHSINKNQRFFLFYLLELVYYRRSHFSNFTEKEILHSAVYIFGSKKIHLQPDEVIDGTPFGRIDDCAKKIIMCQIEAQQSCNFIFKKYQMETKDCVALKGFPHLEGLRNTLVKKINEPEKPPKIVGFCSDMVEKSAMVQRSEMVDEKDEAEAEEKKKEDDGKGLKKKIKTKLR